MSSSSIWPPANFTDWPTTRIGALIINGIMLLLFVIVPSTRRKIVMESWNNCCCCCAELIKAITLGFFMGMFLHFIPCLWWTCDWGPHDGEAIRGAIWFITGPIIGFGILWWECNKKKRTTTSAGKEEEEEEPQEPEEGEAGNNTTTTTTING